MKVSEWIKAAHQGQTPFGLVAILLYLLTIQPRRSSFHGFGGQYRR